MRTTGSAEGSCIGSSFSGGPMGPGKPRSAGASFPGFNSARHLRSRWGTLEISIPDANGRPIPLFFSDPFTPGLQGRPQRGLPINHLNFNIKNR
jgi:hypothetical protein